MDDFQRIIDRQRRYNDEALARFQNMQAGECYFGISIRLAESEKVLREANAIYSARFKIGELIHPTLAVELAKEKLSRQSS